jgi:hypothetical protein
MFFAVPIMKGMAKYSEINELELYDFMVMNEILLVQNENEKRAQAAAEKKAK